MSRTENVRPACLHPGRNIRKVARDSGLQSNVTSNLHRKSVKQNAQRTHPLHGITGSTTATATASPTPAAAPTTSPIAEGGLSGSRLRCVIPPRPSRDPATESAQAVVAPMSARAAARMRVPESVVAPMWVPGSAPESAQAVLAMSAPIRVPRSAQAPMRVPNSAQAVAPMRMPGSARAVAAEGPASQHQPAVPSSAAAVRAICVLRAVQADQWHLCSTGNDGGGQLSVSAPPWHTSCKGCSTTSLEATRRVDVGLHEASGIVASPPVGTSSRLPWCSKRGKAACKL